VSTPRMLTGDRPTGRLHLGHYVGSIANRVRLHRQYDSFFVVADLHMLTTRNTAAEIAAVTERARDMVLDTLAAGVDPGHATFYLQSAVGEVGELNTLLQNLVTVARLQRVPSLKEMARGDEMSYGLLGYPGLQAADILGAMAAVVPVGRDNAAHVEVTREIVRRFTALYGPVLAMPSLLMSQTPTLVGTDGRAKMSKSLGNTIALSDDAPTVRRKVMGMYTDPRRVRADVPGTVEGNPVFAYHDAFNPDRAAVAALKERYRAGRVGDVEVKSSLAEALNRFLDPIRSRRAALAAQPGLVDRLIVEGTERTRREVQQTVYEVRKAMGFAGAYTRLRRKAAATR
jgi:tryptophanyl-tRNA synthetase